VGYVGVAEEGFLEYSISFAVTHREFTPITIQGFVASDGTKRFSSVWSKTSGGKSESRNSCWYHDEMSFRDMVFAGEPLLKDVAMVPDPAKKPGTPCYYATISGLDATREAVGLYGLSAETHLAQCRKLAAQGYRPAAIAPLHLPGTKESLAASVWHRPLPPAPEQQRRASRQATAAATLLHLKQPNTVWPLFRYAPDPTVRSLLIERVGALSVDPLLVLDRLEREPDVTARRALILALGEFAESDLPVAVRTPLVQKLLEWYRDDPDAGIHGAIDWLLRHGKEGPVNRRLDWGQAKELERIDRELAEASRGQKFPGDNLYRWQVNSQGQTFTLIRGPVDFRMGSPLSESGREPVMEEIHRRVIRRSFAIAAKPVTVAQWQQFLKERPKVARDYWAPSGSEPDNPINSLSWYMAAEYCNWLSAKEGIARDQWCYPDDIKPGMKLFPDYLRRTGYRLPTEAEWEYACRAETTSSRYYGSSETLLGRYAWYKANSSNRTWPVGQKRPNDFGLFDMHGNVWQWCQSPMDEPPSVNVAHNPSQRMEDDEDINNTSDSQKLILRGSSFDYWGLAARSACRGRNVPSDRSVSHSLRVARTYR
jgi:formylglycine-generating enzyme required for sulfatase activity